MQAVTIDAVGGPEQLRLRDAPDPVPHDGEVLVAVRVAGVNFIDVYDRTGVYPHPLPYVLGREGCGVVTALGGGVSGVAVGDRVAWAMQPGSYATVLALPAAAALPVPAGLPDATAAALPLQGMTAHYLTRSTVRCAAGMTVVVHAAAGGTGALVVQLAAQAGARVLATVGSPAKAELARQAGAAVVLDSGAADLADQVRAHTDGRGVQAVFDGVGRATFDHSLAMLAPRGTLVLFGQASGAVPPVDLQRLNAAGSVFVTRPSLAHYVADPAERAWRAREVFAAAASGALQVRVGGRWPLAAAADAHRALESRATTGKLLLDVPAAG